MFNLFVKNKNTPHFAKRNLPSGDYVIGGQMPVDILLPDFDEPELGILHLSEEAAVSTASLTPLIEDIQARDHVLKPGAKTVLTEHPFFYGPYEFKVEAIHFSVFGPSRFSLPLVLLSTSVLLIMAALLIGQNHSFFATTSIDAPSGQHQTLPSTTDMTLQSAEAEMRRRLRNVNLDAAVTATQDGSGLLLKGRVTEDERLRLVDVVASARQALHVPIDTDIVSELDASKLIAGVVIEPLTYAMSKDGSHHQAGDILEGGVVLEAIAADSVTLQRDGLKERIAFSAWKP